MSPVPSLASVTSPENFGTKLGVAQGGMRLLPLGGPSPAEHAEFCTAPRLAELSSPLIPSLLTNILGSHLAAGAWPVGSWLGCCAQAGLGTSLCTLYGCTGVCFHQQFRLSRCDKLLQQLGVLICFYCFPYLFVFLEEGKAIAVSHFLTVLSHSSLRLGHLSQKLKY